MYLEGRLPSATSADFIQWIPHEFYRDAAPAMLSVRNESREIVMTPGQWRSSPEHDNTAGRHLPPSSERVTDFMRYFEQRYSVTHLGTASRIMAIPAAHHRLNYVHPFPDGNGRVSRLMSHEWRIKPASERTVSGRSHAVLREDLRVEASTCR